VDAKLRTTPQKRKTTRTSVSFRVVIPGGPVGSQEGRTLNIDAKFFDDLFFTNFCYFQPVTPPSSIFSSSFLLFLFSARSRKHDLILLLSNRRATTMIGSRATPQKKFFGQISPGGPTLRPGGPAPRANA
jgi:hypothetical protein